MRAGAAVMLLTTTAMVLSSTRVRATPATTPTSTIPPRSPLLVLDLDRCAVVPAGDVRDLVGVELRRSVAVVLTAPSPGDSSGSSSGTFTTTEVRVACAGWHAEIAIVDPLTGKTVTRAVDLQAAAPVARTRLLALAVVELLSASWMELENDPGPGAPPVGAGAAPEARAEALEFLRGRPANKRSHRVMATFTTFGPLGSNAGPRQWGAGLLVGGDVAHHMGWMVDLSVGHGSRAFSLGLVTAETVGGLLAVLGHVPLERATLRGGIGARGGGAWLSGMPADPGIAFGGAVRGLWWGPVFLIDGTVALGQRALLGLTFEVGRTILPVTARVQGDSPVVIDGTWLRGTLGVGFVL